MATAEPNFSPAWDRFLDLQRATDSKKAPLIETDLTYHWMNGNMIGIQWNIDIIIFSFILSQHNI